MFTSTVQFVCYAIPEFPAGHLLNTVNTPVKKTKIRAALKTSSCWSLGSPAPLHVDRLRLEEEPLSVRPTLSERRLSACLAPELGNLGGGWGRGGVCFFYWGGSLFSRGQEQKNKSEHRLLC